MYQKYDTQTIQVEIRTTTGGVGESSLTTVNGFRLVEPFGGLFGTLSGAEIDDSRVITHIILCVAEYTASSL